jgi:hypothetical protein
MPSTSAKLDWIPRDYGNHDNYHCSDYVLPWVFSIGANENAHILRVGVSDDVTATQSTSDLGMDWRMDEGKFIISNNLSLYL